MIPHLPLRYTVFKTYRWIAIVCTKNRKKKPFRQTRGLYSEKEKQEGKKLVKNKLPTPRKTDLQRTNGVFSKRGRVKSIARGARVHLLFICRVQSARIQGGERRPGTSEWVGDWAFRDVLLLLLCVIGIFFIHYSSSRRI